MTADLRLVNARVVDGTGAPWFRGSVTVADGEISRVDRGRDGDGDAGADADVA